ncbi:hypothetical protein Pint_06499 [Pistacia integerrima]|uniref:Uncharacterized protein n=1 Tax=Pistacia integerrima TaxID=434235 RepID=A0ACC0Z798_9ROSI|nr:hypothetical protein Pint_06499 [Pistacia integerrima]
MPWGGIKDVVSSLSQKINMYVRDMIHWKVDANMPTNTSQVKSKEKLTQTCDVGSTQAKGTTLVTPYILAHIDKNLQEELNHSAQLKLATQGGPTWPKASLVQFLNPIPTFGCNILSGKPMSQNEGENSNLGESTSTWVKNSRRQPMAKGN